MLTSPCFYVSLKRPDWWSGDHGHSCAGTTASAASQTLQPPQEDAATATNVAQVTPSHEEEVRAGTMLFFLSSNSLSLKDLTWGQSCWTWLSPKWQWHILGIGWTWVAVPSSLAPGCLLWSAAWAQPPGKVTSFPACSLEPLVHKGFKVKWERTLADRSLVAGCASFLFFRSPCTSLPYFWMGTWPKSSPVSGEWSTLAPRCDLTVVRLGAAWLCLDKLFWVFSVYMSSKCLTCQ